MAAPQELAGRERRAVDVAVLAADGDAAVAHEGRAVHEAAVRVLLVRRRGERALPDLGPCPSSAPGRGVRSSSRRRPSLRRRPASCAARRPPRTATNARQRGHGAVAIPRLRASPRAPRHPPSASSPQAAFSGRGRRGALGRDRNGRGEDQRSPGAPKKPRGSRFPTPSRRTTSVAGEPDPLAVVTRTAQRPGSRKVRNRSGS